MKAIISFVIITGLCFLTSVGNLHAQTLSQADKAFYKELSCQAQSQSVLALVETMAERNVPTLSINKLLTAILITPELVPGSPRWTCCRACVENDLPNSSAACQCCDGLGAVLSPILVPE